jgi:hypothetical protein
MAMKGTKAFLEAVGERTSDITLQSNALRHAEKAVILGPAVDAKAVTASTE